MEVVVYTRSVCPLCEIVKDYLEILKLEVPSLEWKEVDIYQDDELLEEYQIRIPVVVYQKQVLAEGNVEYDFLKKKIFENM
ncbi:glutaredoxin family protein [Bacillaceae bacterium S4-13-56]